MIKSVLVGVDGSENSDRALDFALDFAEKFGASLTILNVSESIVMGAVPNESMAYPSDGNAIIARDLRNIQNEIISKCIDHARQAKPNLNVSSIIRDGDAASEIVDTSNNGNFDIVIVGHGGQHGMRERILGSVSEKVAHSAACTAVIVR